MTAAMRRALPAEAYAAALSGLARMTPRRLRVLLRMFDDPADAWAAAMGRSAMPADVTAALADAQLLDIWRATASDQSLADVWHRCRRQRISVHVVRRQPCLAALATDLDPPGVLFTRGSLDTLLGRRVAIVGTRTPSVDARRVAQTLGADLAREGVHVVSGLARGVDAHAHQGALTAEGSGPIGVVACGLDVVYPPEHAGLWRQVAEHGLLLSEVPPGTVPERFRFPQRNRILAALSEVVVVVESRATGGSLITVDAALERQIPVMAVPGSLRNPAASGTNALLRDGAAAVLDAGDVLAVLGIDHRRTQPMMDRRPALRSSDAVLVDACAGVARTVDELVLLTSRGVSDVAMTVARLSHEGWLSESDGWFEAVGPPP